MATQIIKFWGTFCKYIEITIDGNSLLECLILIFFIFNRPGVAGAVLQTASLLCNSLSQSSFVEIF